MIILQKILLKNILTSAKEIHGRKDERLFVCLMMESLWVIDCYVWIAILLVFISEENSDLENANYLKTPSSKIWTDWVIDISLNWVLKYPYKGFFSLTDINCYCYVMAVKFNARGNLENTDLQSSDPENTDLKSTDLENSDLQSRNFKNTNLSNLLNSTSMALWLIVYKPVLYVIIAFLQ